jgi:putative SOS response-associated peptidase YedK
MCLANHPFGVPEPLCGRISRTSPREALVDEFGVARFVNVNLRPRYNVAPSENIETIIRVGDEKPLGPMRWGFVRPGRCAQS